MVAEIAAGALTGESLNVIKQSSAIKASELPLGDRDNLAFKSTIITKGKGVGLVVATGLDTEIGHIASLLSGESAVRTPLQQRLTRFSRFLALAVLVICSIVFAAGLFQGQPVLLMFLTAVSLAVAAIPEALPAVITISLAFGAKKLIAHNALVRNLPAVETLGSVTYICTDKTGTLTENRMKVERFFAGGELFDQFPVGLDTELLEHIGRGWALNNDINETEDGFAGEPTELALFEAAKLGGYDKALLETSFPRIASVPFDSGRKLMSTIHGSVPRGVSDATDVAADRSLVYTKGAPERVLARCHGGFGESHDRFDASAVLAQAEKLAAEGYRVLALAMNEVDCLPEQIDSNSVETGLLFLCLVAIIDPIRPEVHCLITYHHDSDQRQQMRHGHTYHET